MPDSQSAVALLSCASSLVSIASMAVNLAILSLMISKKHEISAEVKELREVSMATKFTESSECKIKTEETEEPSEDDLAEVDDDGQEDGTGEEADDEEEDEEEEEEELDGEEDTEEGAKE
jgi:hypothetical protein